MTRDDIIRMAQQAGMFKLFGDPNAPEALTGESIERFAALVAVYERNRIGTQIRQLEVVPWPTLKLVLAAIGEGQ